MMEATEGSGLVILLLGERQDEMSPKKPPAQNSNCTKFEKGLNENILSPKERKIHRETGRGNEENLAIWRYIAKTKQTDEGQKGIGK